MSRGKMYILVDDSQCVGCYSDLHEARKVQTSQTYPCLIRIGRCSKEIERGDYVSLVSVIYDPAVGNIPYYTHYAKK